MTPSRKFTIVFAVVTMGGLVGLIGWGEILTPASPQQGTQVQPPPRQVPALPKQVAASGDEFNPVYFSEPLTSEQRVVQEMTQRYEVVTHGGTFSDICAQAGSVKAAYLQAHDVDGYRNWGITEKYACGYVGGDGNLTVRQFADELSDKATAYATTMSELQKYDYR